MGDYKGFMTDFAIADKFGEAAVIDTFNRTFKEWKNNVEYFASFVLTLNHRLWLHYENGRTSQARLYDGLWKKAHAFGTEHFKGKDAEYYFSFLD